MSLGFLALQATKGRAAASLVEELADNQVYVKVMVYQCGSDNLIRILCFCTFFQILRHYVWRFRILFLFLQTERRGRGYVPPSFFGGIFNLRLPNMLIANVLRFGVRRVNMDYNPPCERRAMLG